MNPRFFKMLMNQEGASPGGGAAPPAPAQPPAQPAAPPAPAFATVDQVQTVVNGAITGLRNGLFADLRKAGVFKDSPPAPETPPAGTPPAGATPRPLAAADVERLLERERVFTRIATKHELSDAQLSRMQRAMTADAPEDISAWATQYLTDMNLAKGTNPPPPAPGQPTVPPASGSAGAAAPARPASPPGPTLSDRGPAAGAPRDFAAITNPNDLTKDDISRLQETLGFDAANKKITELSMKWLANKRLRPGADPPR